MAGITFNSSSISEAEIDLAVELAFRMIDFLRKEQSNLFKEAIENRIRGKIIDKLRHKEIPGMST